MANEPAGGPVEGIETKIHFMREQRVMLDSDLAKIYGVMLKRLNEQVRRNHKRFPEDFCFQLTRHEFTNLKSQFATSNVHGGKRKLPWVFTEHGAIMLAAVLNSEAAIQASVFVVRAFVRMREMLMANRELAAKLDELERRVGGHDKVIGELVEAIRELLNPTGGQPRREIGFHVKNRSHSTAIQRKRF